MQYLKTEVRQRILTAAEQEFKQHGYMDASIRTIADSAGISLGNIYRYFNNKEALFCAVIEPLMSEIAAKIEEAFVVTDDTKIVADTVVDFLWANADKLAIILQGNNYNFDSFKRMLNDLAERTIEKLFATFPLMQSKIKNPDFTYVISSSFLHALNLVAFHKGDKEEQKRNVKELVTFFFEDPDQRFKDY